MTATAASASNRNHGFTLIELIVTVAIVAVLAWVTVPLFEITATRVKEVELRSALRQIRAALDAYKTAGESGAISKRATESGYPPSLETLVQGVETNQIGSKMLGAQMNQTGGKPRLVFLRQIPRDPFFPDQAVPAARQWATRAYGSLNFDPTPGDDVFDVASRSERTALNGTTYRDW